MILVAGEHSCSVSTTMMESRGRGPVGDATGPAAVDRALVTLQSLLRNTCISSRGRPAGQGMVQALSGAYTLRRARSGSRWWRPYCAAADAGPSGASRTPPLNMPRWAGRSASVPFRPVHRAVPAAPAFRAARVFRAERGAKAERTGRAAPEWQAARSATTSCCGRVPATASAARRRERIRYHRPGRARRQRILRWWGTGGWRSPRRTSSSSPAGSSMSLTSRPAQEPRPSP
jgi:hypothetical protein